MAREKKGTPGEKTVTVNRKAFHDYEVLETIEAGIVLTGTEIKSIREGRVNLKDGYVRVQNAEAWLYNVHISEYGHASAAFNHEPTRARKLLLHGREIMYLGGKVQAKGLTVVPLRLYLTRGKAKLELGLSKGRREYDKRDAIADREAAREIEREMRGKR